MQGLVHVSACTNRAWKPRGYKGQSAGLDARLVQALLSQAFIRTANPSALSLRHVIDPRPARLGSARVVLAAGRHPARTCGACIPQSTRYIYSSCSRIILKGFGLISILKTAPNSPF